MTETPWRLRSDSRLGQATDLGHQLQNVARARQGVDEPATLIPRDWVSRVAVEAKFPPPTASFATDATVKDRCESTPAVVRNQVGLTHQAGPHPLPACRVPVRS